jgi:hypothetical protein
MSADQYWQTVQQWAEMEAEGRAEAEWRRMEDINLALQEVAEARAREDEEFRAELEAKYPQLLAAWPGRTK